MSLKLTVASILLLLLCSEVLGAPKKVVEEKTVLAQIKDGARDYYNYVSRMTTSWIDSIKSWDISKQAWNRYQEVSTIFDTYRNILSDQVKGYFSEP